MDNERISTLVRALQNGDNSAASTIYSVFYNDIYYFILKTIKDPDLASDLTQDTFIEIIETIGKLRVPAAFIPWSKKIAYHHCTKYLRKRRELLFDEMDDGYSILDLRIEEKREFIPDESLDQSELQNVICSMIDALPEEQRNAIIMRYYDEISLKDIAKIQKTTEGTVKSRLNYGRKSIKQSVEEYEKRNNIKIHCVGVVPILLWYFKEERLSKGISLTQLTPTAEIFSSLITNTTKDFRNKILATIISALFITSGTGIILNANSNEPHFNSTEAESSESFTQHQTSQNENTEDSEDTSLYDNNTETYESSHPEKAEPQKEVQLSDIWLTLSDDGSYYAVTNCVSTTNVDIPAEYNEIPITTLDFLCSDLSGISLSENITEIKLDTLREYPSLSYINVSKDNPVYHSSGNCVIETANKTLVFGCKDSIIPSDGSVKSIGTDAFSSCTGLTNLILPNTITTIGEGAFAYSGLTSITIPESVIHIANNAFYNCLNLSSVNFSDGIVSIDYAAFSNCTSLSEISLPNSIEKLDSNVFSGCSNLNTITVAESNFVFHSAGNCIIDTLNKMLISGCNTSIIPSDGSVVEIGPYAFSGQNNLLSLSIPNNIVAIYGAFYECPNLKDLYYDGTIAQWNSIKVYDDFSSITIHCTDGDITL